MTEQTRPSMTLHEISSRLYAQGDLEAYRNLVHYIKERDIAMRELRQVSRMYIKLACEARSL